MAKKRDKGNKHVGIIIGVLIIIILIIAAFFVFSGNKIPQEEIDVFAKCLTEKGAVMYGAFWCPHCARTKARFGSSFQYIKYVECDPRGDNEQSQLCIQKEIESYDTWEFADSSRLVGEPTFEAMAEKTGCIAPGAGN